MTKHVITEILGNADDFKDKVRGFDRLLVTSDERSSPHLLRETEGGRTVRISLPRGTELNDGDVIELDGDIAVIVAAADEDLFVISPNSPIEGGIAGYQLGNLHRPVRFTENKNILTPFDPTVRDILDHVRIRYKRLMLPFVGKRYGSHKAHNHHD